VARCFWLIIGLAGSRVNTGALASVVLQCAAELDIKIRWGGDWSGDGRSSDERFFDGPHFELV
jgi:peptidoglycan L-alanyl-D-glutamate endopeptidase CwlK